MGGLLDHHRGVLVSREIDRPDQGLAKFGQIGGCRLADHHAGIVAIAEAQRAPGDAETVVAGAARDIAEFLQRLEQAVDGGAGQVERAGNVAGADAAGAIDLLQYVQPPLEGADALRLPRRPGARPLLGHFAFPLLWRIVPRLSSLQTRSDCGRHRRIVRGRYQVRRSAADAIPLGGIRWKSPRSAISGSTRRSSTNGAGWRRGCSACSRSIAAARCAPFVWTTAGSG